MWKKIFKHLKAKGLDVQAPGIKKGPYKDPFVVLKHGGEASHAGTSHSRGYFDLFVYIPFQRYSTLEEYRKKVVDAMKELTDIRKTGTETPVIYEEDPSCYTFSIEYILMKA